MSPVNGQIQIDPEDLRTIHRTLDGAGGDLFKQAKPLQKTPDAGASTKEVASALAALATAVSGAAEGLGQLGDGVQDALGHATTSDHASAEAGRRQQSKLEHR